MGDNKKNNLASKSANKNISTTPLSKNSTIRIEIASKITDPRAAVRLQKINQLELKNQATDVKIIDVYTIHKQSFSLRDKKFSIPEVNQIAQALSNPVTDFYSFEAPINPAGFAYAIEIGFLPGVTDNVAHTAKETIQDLLNSQGSSRLVPRSNKKESSPSTYSHSSSTEVEKYLFKNGENVYTSQLTLVSGNLSAEDVQKIADSLYNPLIQRAQIKNSKRFEVEKGMDVVVPKVELTQVPEVTNVNLNVSDEELIKIGKEGIANVDGTRRGPLALDLLYMKTIQEYFKEKGRNPTDIELESLAQTWSEHCKHTIFSNPLDEIEDGLFKTYIRGATEKIKSKFVAKVFNDNSGAIDFDKDFYITHKVETHNTPSALDPFGGSITGIVGVNRDALGFGLGAKPIFNTYGFCFADPADDKPLYKGENFTQKMLSPRRIMEGVIAGVNAGGNQSGIPTPAGFLYFDKRYKGKPLVFCGTVGLIPKKSAGRDSRDKKACPGDLIVMVGGKVGIDGVHGATFSSEGLDPGSPVSAVQIGDPITQKKFSDAIVKEIRDMGLFNSITDNGAGGLSSSVSEMASEAGGCLVELDKVPLKYPGLEPWQIWISESQERMTLAVPKNKLDKLQEIFGRRGVESWVIGEFNDSGKCEVRYKGTKVLEIEMEFLHDGLPKENQNSKVKIQKFEEPDLKTPISLTNTLLKMLGRLNISSYDFISTQYDHTVQGLVVTYPVQGRGRVNSENAVVRPRLDSDKGLVLSQGMYPAYSDIDTYHMAAASIDTAVKNTILAGADPEKIALLDNFCWCSSSEPERLYQLKMAAKACFDYATAYGTPFISGKDSMFNDFKGFDEEGKPVKISVPPTLLISTIGVMGNVHKAVTLDVKFAGDLVYVLGETFDEMGASEFYGYLGDTVGKKYIGKSVPNVDAKKNLKLYLAYSEALNAGLIASAIGVNRGGLGVALAKTTLGGGLGIEASLSNLPGKFSGDIQALYSESQGRILLTINPQNKTAFEKTLKGNAFAQIGTIIDGNSLTITGKSGKQVISTDLEMLKQSYKERFKGW